MNDEEYKNKTFHVIVILDIKVRLKEFKKNFQNLSSAIVILQIFN